MSDPQPTSLNKKPPRAEPLQPDRPGSGDEQSDSSPEASAEEVEKRTEERTTEQEETALKNVNQGYD